MSRALKIKNLGDTNVAKETNFETLNQTREKKLATGQKCIKRKFNFKERKKTIIKNQYL